MSTSSGGPRPGREDASASIWRDPPQPSAKRVRIRATIQWLVGLGIGALLYFVFHRPVLAIVACCIASFVFLLGVFSPLGAHAAVDRVFVGLGRVVGSVLTWLLLAPVFYLFLTPFGLLRRRGARDTLQRSFDASRKSYWTPREGEDRGPTLDRPY